VKTLTRII